MLENKYPSPCGKYHFQIAAWEARMSLWIESPTLFETDTQKILLRFGDSNWSLDSADWLDDERVEISLRRYPGDHTPSSFEVELNCLTREATSDGVTLEFAGLESHLQSLYRQGQSNSRAVTAKPNRMASFLFWLRG